MVRHRIFPVSNISFPKRITKIPKIHYTVRKIVSKYTKEIFRFPKLWQTRGNQTPIWKLNLASFQLFNKKPFRYLDDILVLYGFESFRTQTLRFCRLNKDLINFHRGYSLKIGPFCVVVYETTQVAIVKIIDFFRYASFFRKQNERIS